MGNQPIFVFDAPRGVYTCAWLSRFLWAQAVTRGPERADGALPLRERSQVSDPRVQEALVAQARVLRREFPDITPELRAAVPPDFGRSIFIAWYDPRFEGTYLRENTRLPEAAWLRVDDG